MAKKTAPAKKAAAKSAPKLTISADCDRNGRGYGALAFVQHTNHIVNRGDVSALKTLLFKAGFETNEMGLMEWSAQVSDEVRGDQLERWEEEDCVLGWDPRNALEGGEAWALVAVLAVREDGQSVHDAVAVMARPATPVQAWPFPPGKPGESGPEVRSSIPSASEQSAEQSATESQTVVAPAASATVTARKGFFIPSQARLLVVKTTPHKEHHGKDLVQAVSLRLRWETTGEALNLLHPNLQAMLFYRSAPVEAQEELPDLPKVMPNLRVPTAVLPLKIDGEHTGYTLKIEHGIDDSTALELYTCHLQKFTADGHEGGTAVIEWSLHSNQKITPELVGILYGLEGTTIVADLTPPTVTAGEAIDGSVGHPGAAAAAAAQEEAKQDPTSVFCEAHGRSADGAPQEPGELDGQGDGEERQAEETTS